MKSRLIEQLDTKFEELESQEELEEENATGAMDGGAGPIQTPNAFSKDKKEKTNIKYPGVAERIEKSYENIIESISYRDFRSEPKTTPASKVTGTIKEVAKKLKEIDTLMKHATRLKSEAGVTQDHYWKSTSKHLTKIGESLIKLGQKARSLGE